MKAKIKWMPCIRVRNVVVRKVEEEMSHHPCRWSGADDAESEPYFLNATGQIIWQRLNGRRRLKDIVSRFSNRV